jgi:hypothetical protein
MSGDAVIGFSSEQLSISARADHLGAASVLMTAELANVAVLGSTGSIGRNMSHRRQ